MSGFTARSARVWTLGDPDAPALSFNGVDAAGVEWVIADPKGWYQTPPVDLGLEDAPGDGAFYGRGAYKARVLEVSGAFRVCRHDPDLLDDTAQLLIDAVGDPRTSTLFAVTEKVPKQVTVRPSAEVLISPVAHQPRARTFSFVLTAADPFKYAAGAAGLVSVPLALQNPAAMPGAAHPLAHPLNHGGATAGALGGRAVTVNPGRVPVAPIITINGPVSQPMILNASTGEFFAVAADLLAGQSAVIDMGLRTVIVGGASRLALKGPRSTFWRLPKGANDLRFSAAAYSATATATVTYRPAWK